jgi:hypothetical protein
MRRTAFARIPLFPRSSPLILPQSGKSLPDWLGTGGEAGGRRQGRDRARGRTRPGLRA